MTSFVKTYEYDYNYGFKINDEYKTDKNAFIFSLNLKKFIMFLKLMKLYTMIIIIFVLIVVFL